MTDTEVKAFLEHFGVKGQKWGVRNSKPPIKLSGDAKKIAELKKKPVGSLTNKQLKTLNERLNLESNHNKLNPGKVMTGKKKAELVLGTIGIGATAYNWVNSPAGKAVQSLGKKSVFRHGAKQLSLF